MKKVARFPAALTVLALAGCTQDVGQGRVVGELASDRIELAAESAEPFVEILVPEGAAVEAGQALMRQDTARADTQVAEADAAVAQAKAKLAELVRGPRREQITAARAKVGGARKELDFRTAELARIRDIQGKGLASAEALDSAAAAFDAATANLETLRAQLQELLAGTTVEELAQAESALASTEASRLNVLIGRDRLTIRAPVAGVFDSRLFESGERPAPGQVVGIVLSGTQPYARVYVPESLRVRVRPGTAARIYVDGIETAIDGRVRWIASEAAFTPYFALTERDRGRLSFLAKVDISEERERLPDGVPVEVEFRLTDSGQ